MIIGIPKEIKDHEYRVAMVPSGVAELINDGHKVLIEHNAGLKIGYDNDAYKKVGAIVISNVSEIFAQSDMIVKVKEPQPQECKMLCPGQILFTFLHLAPDHQQIQGLLDSDCIAIGYETVTDDANSLPLLAPMSEVAGRLSIQAGAAAMESHRGGSGLLLGGVPGVEAANVMVIGGGIVGINAARIAVGAGANVTVFDRDNNVLKKIDNDFNGRIKTMYSNAMNIYDAACKSHLIIGAVLIRGDNAPKIIKRTMLSDMIPGTVVVDVAIDQGGCFESSMPTTHENPTYIVNNIIHYCVANMPGSVARTSTFALTNATLPFIMSLANKKLSLQNKHLLNGLNIYRGNITYQAVANSFNGKYVHPVDCIK